MIFFLGKTQLRIRFSLVLFLCIMPMLGGRLFALLLLSVALHEAGHLLFLAGCRAPVLRIDFSLHGVAIETQRGTLSPVQTILLNLSGPAMNGISAGFAALLLTGFDAMRFCAVSLAVGTVNLIPFGTTDGSSALECTVELLSKDTVKAQRRLSAVRLAFGGGVLLLITLAWIRYGWQWFYLLGFYYFASALVEERGGLWYNDPTRKK